jgi:aryl-alcohol dehydrogenase-like predicted oxidoreductase
MSLMTGRVSSTPDAAEAPGWPFIEATAISLLTLRNALIRKQFHCRFRYAKTRQKSIYGAIPLVPVVACSSSRAHLTHGERQLDQRKLGHSGIDVAPFALGGNVFGWTADEATSFSLLDAFTSSGFNLIDTADIYANWAPGLQGGESESILGKWFARGGKRSQVVLATKVGMEMGPDRKGLSRRYILDAVDVSLRRLQTDYIDLYQSHQDDADTPFDETLEAYAQLIKQGKVRVIGASNYSAERLKASLKVSAETGLPAYQTLQPHYNLYDRAGFEGGAKRVCEQYGCGVLTYFSLANGFLTGKYRDATRLGNGARADAVRPYLNPRGMRILGALDAVSEGLGKKPAQIALAWLMAQPTVVAPIASATSLVQLDELMASASLRLPAEAMRMLDSASET